MSMIHDIKTFLQSKGIEETIYLGNMPDSPDKAIALFEDEGLEYVQYTELKRIMLQVILRDEEGNYETAYSLMESIHNLLDNVGNEINGSGEAININEDIYFRIYAKGSGIAHMKDENGRIVLKKDYIVIRS